MKDKNNSSLVAPQSTLPKGWVWTKLGEITEIILGQSPPSTTYNENGIGHPFYQGKSEFGNIYPTPQKWCSSPKKIAEKGDVLISVRAPVGPTNICPEKSCIGRGLAAIRGLEGIETHLILYLMRAFENVIAGKATGTTFDAITGDQIKKFKILLPPLPEQHRIVAKIEEVFTKLDVGVRALKKVKVELKRYRQVVLKHAFEGKLTEEWRKANKGKIEPASVLLMRIKEEREKDTKGKSLCLSLRRSKMTEVILKDEIASPSARNDNLPELPAEWVWTMIKEIAESMKNGIYKQRQFYSNNGIACLRMYNIEDGSIVWKDIKRMNLTPEEIHEYELKPGDILVNRVNSRELVGKAAPIPLGLETCVFESKNIRLRIFRNFVESKYVSFWFHVFSQQYFNRNAQQTVGMASINQEQLGSMPIPLPPLPEQHKIVEEIERRFSVADEVERVVEESLKQAERLRQSILKRAFEGKLVPQDPSDEPAEKLLERIKAEKARLELSKKDRIKTRKRKLPEDFIDKKV